MPTSVYWRLLNTTKAQISSWSIMGVPRITVTYTLKMALTAPKTGFFFRPGRCWS